MPLEAAAVPVVPAISAGISISTALIKAIDFGIGVYTKKTPNAVLWSNVLSELREELGHAQDQLILVKGEIGPMRVKLGPGADAANLTRKEVKFDELLLKQANQLKESEIQFRSSTDEFNQNNFFNWTVVGALDSLALKAVAPMQHHVHELKANRQRIHNARQFIKRAFVAHCCDAAGDQFPTFESPTGSQGGLALKFLVPEPFCHKFDAEASLTSGLFLCNRNEASLKELHDRIQEKAALWMSTVGWEAAKPESTITTLDVLEKCQRKMLAQLDVGIFGPVIDSNSLFTTVDRTIAIRGQCMIQDWHSILLGGEGGIMIALGGKMNAGKSSIINAMLGRPLLPTASMSFVQWQCRP